MHRAPDERHDAVPQAGPVTIASWLVAVDTKRIDAAAEAIGRLAGLEVRGRAGQRLVVVSEAPGPLDVIQASLQTIDGVADVALAAAYDATQLAEEP